MNICYESSYHNDIGVILIIIAPGGQTRDGTQVFSQISPQSSGIETRNHNYSQSTTTRC